MGGMYRYEFVTAPVISSNITIVVSIANISQDGGTALVVAMPSSVQGMELDLPPQSIQVAELGLGAGKGPNLQVWFSILVSSDQLVPTATIIDDAGTHFYLPGDFAAFDRAAGPARLW